MEGSDECWYDALLIVVKIKLKIHVRVLLGTPKMRVRGISGSHWLCPGQTGTTISMSYKFFISFQ